ncbi:hypothetical protein KKB16_02160 [Patescibacteria group bacterium]|nr:hypothetical protein [Patescibacteria group bacterium]MBU4389859.1 hypothetical protein [Patescibacteria group bacterium]MBU4430898.1 hypothetical protein [Patescibacteria group bacterium]MBU4578912.1 hypothetical protein [Patescibacteria group bacterium]
MKNISKTGVLNFVKYFLFLGIIVGIGIHLWVAINQKIWVDEFYTVFFSRSLKVSELFDGYFEPIHPPFYYLLINFLSSFSSSTIFLRLFQFFVFLFSLLIVYKIVGLLKFNSFLKLFFLNFWSLSPYVLRFTYQLRMYGLGILFCLLSLYLLLKYLETNRELFLPGVLLFNVLGFGMVFGFVFFIWIEMVSLFIFWVFLGIKKAKIPFFLFLCFSFFSFLGLLSLLVFGKSIEEYVSWVEIPSFLDLGSFVSVFLGLVNYYEKNYYFEVGFLVIFFAFAKLYSFFRKKKKLYYFNLLPDFVLLSGYVAVLMLCCLWFCCHFFDLHYFQMRQFFPIAILLMFMVFAWLNMLFKKNWVLVILICILLSCRLYNQLGQGYLFGNTVYEEICEDCKKISELALENPLFVFEGDYSFLYDVCGVSNIYEDVGRCVDIGIEFVLDNEDLVERAKKVDKYPFFVRFPVEDDEALFVEEMRLDGYFCYQHNDFANLQICFSGEKD